jgi:hypothetical protein
MREACPARHNRDAALSGELDDPGAVSHDENVGKGDHGVSATFLIEAPERGPKLLDVARRQIEQRQDELGGCLAAFGDFHVLAGVERIGQHGESAE